MVNRIRFGYRMSVYYWIGDEPTMSTTLSGRPGWGGAQDGIEPGLQEPEELRKYLHKWIDKYIGKVVGLEQIEMPDPDLCSACNGVGWLFPQGQKPQKCEPCDGQGGFGGEEWRKEAEAKLAEAAIASVGNADP